MLPAFVLYWTAAADFNFAVGTGAFKELYSMDFYFLLGAAISFWFLWQHIIKTPALYSTGVNFCEALRLITERREFHRRRKVCL